MLLKTQTKILLLSAILATFLIGILFIFKLTERNTAISTVREIHEDEIRDLHNMLALFNEPLRSFVHEHITAGEAKTILVMQEDSTSRANLFSLLKEHHAIGAWIYGSDFSYKHRAFLPAATALLNDASLDSTIASTLSKGPASHYYTQSSLGILEVQSAQFLEPAGLSSDSNKSGFFIAARLIDKNFVDELTNLNDGEFAITVPDSSKDDTQANEKSLSDGQSRISIPLLDANGKPVASIARTEYLPFLHQALSSTETAIRFTAIFLGIILAPLMFFIYRWVGQPLNTIMKSLQEGIPKGLKEITDRSIEFHRISDLITSFFKQKNEMESHLVHLTQTEAELKEQKDFASAIIDAIPGPFFVLDQNGKYELWNTHLENVTGKSADELKHVLAITTIHEPDRSSALGAIMKVFEKGHGELEARLICANNEIRDYYFTGNRMFIRGKAFLVGTGLDITYRSLIGNEKKSTRDYLDGIVHAIADPLFVKDSQHRFVILNDAFTHISGHRAEDLLGKSDFDFFPPAEAKVYWDKDDEVIRTGVCNENEEELTDINGEKKVILTKKSVYRDPITGDSFLIGIIRDISIRKQAERRLKFQSEVLSQIRDAVIAVDNNNQVTYINRGAEELYQTSVKEATSYHLDDLFEYSWAVDLEREAFERILAATGEWQGRVRIRTNSEEPIWIELSISHLHDGNGGQNGSLLISRDITDQKKAEDELGENHRMLSTLMEHLPGMIYRCRNNRDRTVEFASEGCFKLTGCTPDDLVESKRRSLQSLMHPDDRGVLLQMQRNIENGQNYSLNYRIVTADGVTKWVWDQGRAFTLWNEGKVILEGFMLDVTDKKYEEEMNVRLSTAVDQAAEAIMITDKVGNIQYANPAFSSITGFSKQEIVGQNPKVLRSGRHSTAFFTEFWKTLHSKKVWSGRIINKRKDGRFIETDTIVSPVLDSSGSITNFVQVSRDVTEIVDMEIQLRQAQKLEAVGSLAAGIAHEINTPVQFIGDNTHFLSDAFRDLLNVIDNALAWANSNVETECKSSRQDFLDQTKTADIEYLKEEIPKAIDQTIQGVERVSTIVRAMKDFSHPDKIEKTAVDINNALATTLIVARNELKYVADVKTEFGTNLPHAMCHAGEMNQVFLNLLVNASHAIGDVVHKSDNKRGIITVRTYQEEEQIVIEIEDTGTGIKPELRDRIFDPFFTTKGVGRGTGQGLAIARSVVVEKHGGTLTFKTVEKVGSTFIVKLPIDDIVKPEPAKPYSIADSSQLF